MSSSVKFQCVDDSGNPIFLVDSTNGIYHKNTRNSSNASTGALLLYGGLSINSTTNSINTSNGGVLTVAGGGSFAKDVYIGGDLRVYGSQTLGNVTLSNLTSGNILTNNINLGISNIYSGSFTSTNNQSIASNVTGLSFPNATITSFVITLTVNITTNSNNYYETFTLEGTQTNSGWSLFSTKYGDNSGIVFSITNNGQIQYTSTNINNFTNGLFNFSVNQITKTGNYSYVNTTTQGTLVADVVQILSTNDSNLGVNNGSLYLLGGATILKSLYVGTSISSSNAILTNISSNTLNISNISASIITTGTLNVNTRLSSSNILSSIITTGTLNATTSITSGALFSTNVTSTNIVSTALSTSTLNVSTNILSTSVNATNATVTNIVGTTLSTGTLNVTTSVSTAAVNATNITGTNIVGTTISTGTLNATTSVSTAAVNATNITGSNIVGTTISSGTLNATTSISTAAVNATNSTVTNIVGTTISAGTIVGTTLISSANIATSLITTGSINVTTLVSSTNISASLITTGTLVGSIINGLGNSNTLGSIITTGGNIGINTVSPSSKLHVHGGILASTNTAISYQGVHLQWNRSGAEGESWIINQKGGGTSNSGIRFGKSDTSNNVTELMRILDSGNVGIATTSPGTTLDVSGTFRATTSVTSGALYATNVTATNIVGTNISTGVILANTFLSASGNSNTLGSLFTTAGNIGIGTSTPLTKLNVQSDASGIYASDSGQIIISGATNSNKRLGIAIDTTNNVGILQAGLSGTTTYSIALNPGGSNVGIGTTSPGTTLDVFGTFRATTSVTSGALYATNVTATNVVGTTISAGTIVSTTLVSSANVTASLITTGTLNAATLVSSANISASLITTGTLNAATLISSANVTASLITAGTLNATTLISSANISASLITTGTLNAATLVSSANLSSSIISTGTLVGSIITINGTTRIINTSASSRGTLTIAGPGSDTYLPTITTIGQLMTMYGPGGANVFSNIDLSTFEPTSLAMNLPSVRFSMQDLGGWSTSFNILTKNFGSTGTMASRMFIDGSGNIGIGTTSPGESLDLRGNLRIGNNTQSNYISFYGTYGDGLAEYSHTFIGERIYGGSEQSELLLFKGNDMGATSSGPDRIRLLAAEHRFDTYTSPVSGSFENVGSTVASNRMIINSAGNVGIGTILPIYNLDVTGTIRATTSITSAALFGTNITGTNIVGTNISTGILNATTSVTSAALFSLNITSSNIVGTNASISTLLASTRVSSANLNCNIISSATLITSNITSANIVGTSNISTANLLATTRVSTANLNSAIISTGTLIAINNSNTLGSLFTTNGNVGIGTVSPQGELHIQATNLTSLLSTWSGVGSYSNIDFSYDNSSFFGIAASARIKVLDNNYGGDIYIQNRDQGSDNSNMNTRLFIGASGNIGIATETPSSKFEIVTSDTTGLRHTGTYITSVFPLTTATTQLETYINNKGGWLRTYTNDALNFTVNNGSSSYLTINTNGNIGINTNTPQVLAQLEVNGSTYINGTNDNVCLAVDGANSNKLRLGIVKKAGTGPTIATSNNSDLRFQVANSNDISQVSSNTYTTLMTLTTGGSLIINGTPDTKSGILDVSPSSVAYHSTTLMSAYAQTISYGVSTNGSLGIAFGISSSASITPGASIIHERTNINSLGLLHFCTKSGTAATSANLIRMSINSAGNVGIGTTSPSTKLELSDSTGSSNAPFLKLSGAGGAGNQVGIKLNPYSGRSGGDSSQIIAVDDGASSSHLTFYTAAGGAASTSTERMRITNSGNIGIGTNSPGTLLEVRTGSSAKGIRHSDGTIQFDTYVGGSVSGGYLQTTSNHPLVLTVNDGTPKLTVNTNGNIGIGTNTPAYQFQLSSDSAAKPSTNTWTVSSDERLKTNIQLADLDICYNVIKNLPLKRYTWKDEVYTIEEVPDRSKLGWIAQDVETIIPKAVEKVSMLGYDDCRTLNSDQIIASLYGCVQKLIRINESQDEEIHNLNEKINKTISENEIKNIEMRQLIERIVLLEERIYNNFSA